MGPRITFRTGTAMVVTAYAVLAGVLVCATGSGLGEPVLHYIPQVSWLTPETTDLRIAALKGAGLFGTAGLYALVVAMSHGLIAALTAGGFVWGVLNHGRTTLGVDRAITYISAIAGLYALSTMTEFALHALAEFAPQGGLNAMPAMWFAGMIPSAAILARIGALIAHDFGSLLILALEGDQNELDEFATIATETRGQDSIEAALARRMTGAPALRAKVAAWADDLAKRATS